MANERAPVFAELLRRARRSAGFSQEELAERAGLSARAISALERGVNRSPRRDTLDMLGDALSLSNDERQRWENIRRTTAIRSMAGGDKRPQLPPQAGSTNLPTQSTRFFGRDAVLSSLQYALRQDETRLVTLTGPGGSGKTRLAIQTASTLLPEYPDGIFFIDLAPLNDPQLGIAAIATSLGLRERTDQPVRAVLASWLAGKRLLLVLDNMEQILGLAPDIGTLLERSASLQVLATSRAPLRLRAEREISVPPLPLPEVEDLENGHSATDYDAVRLFIDRARSIQSTFRVKDEGDARVIAHICRQLDGLPLAIELVAACVRLLPPRSIQMRLEQHLPLPDRGPRDAPARQRTLHDTVAWSFDLLAPQEQALLRRLSLFKGGWTLEAAEAVGHDIGVPSGDVLHGLAELVEHNLIRVQEWLDDTPRCSMLETIRQFALALLDQHHESDLIRLRHATFFTQMFEGSERDWHSQQAEGWLQVADAEIENVRLALAWTMTHDPELALRLACATSWIWFMRGSYLESQAWLEQTLAGAGEVSETLRAGALWWIGAHATTLGDYPKARAVLEESLSIQINAGDSIGAARCLHGLGRIAMFDDDPEMAITLFESAVELFHQQFDPAIMVTLINLGGVLVRSGKLDQAGVVLEEALLLAERDGLDWHRAQIIDAQGYLALERGDLPAACAALVRSLHLHKETRDLRFVSEALEICAWLLIAMGTVEQGARILGAVRTMRETIGVPVPPSIQGAYNRYTSIARETLNAERWEQFFSKGRTMAQTEAIEFALQALS